MAVTVTMLIGNSNSKCEHDRAMVEVINTATVTTDALNKYAHSGVLNLKLKPKTRKP